MNCHEQAVKDFDLQIEMIELEASMLKDKVYHKVLPYNETEFEELEQRKLRLLLGKRFHQNAANAYWYHMKKTSK